MSSDTCYFFLLKCLISTKFEYDILYNVYNSFYPVALKNLHSRPFAGCSKCVLMMLYLFKLSRKFNDIKRHGHQLLLCLSILNLFLLKRPDRDGIQI